MKFSMKMAAVAAMAGIGFSAAQAMAAPVTINYSSVTSNGITISGISENDSDGFAHYGQPVFSNGVLTFPGLSQFLATAHGGGTAASSDLDAKLTFTVTLPNATTNLFNLNEQGDFAAYGGGNASILLAGIATTGSNPLPLGASGTGTVDHVLPFFVATPTQSGFNWVGTLNPVSSSAVSTFTFTLDNDLTASAPIAAPPGSFSDIEKKSLIITFPGGGTPPSPEPASLGMLALGSLALLGRRRKA